MLRSIVDQARQGDEEAFAALVREVGDRCIFIAHRILRDANLAEDADEYGANYKHYWVDEEAGKVFCLVDAPDRDTAARVHREAHGLEAQTLHLVEQGA